jgi:hypothetical protein
VNRTQVLVLSFSLLGFLNSQMQILVNTPVHTGYMWDSQAVMELNFIEGDTEGFVLSVQGYSSYRTTTLCHNTVTYCSTNLDLAVTVSPEISS